MAQFLTAGVQVRLKTDPGRIGVTTEKRRVRVDIPMLLVQFPDRGAWCREDALEVVTSESDDAYAMLEKKQFGHLSDYQRNLTYVQLSGKLANLVYSMDTTNTEFYAYQFKPVLSFLDSPAKGLLIADEVGLGKTIEAGLIWTELRARFDARRLLVVCPAMLREKWKDELSFRFGIDAQLMSADELHSELKRSRYDFPPDRAIVCSYEGIRPPKASTLKDNDTTGGTAKLARLLDDKVGDETLFDLVIFDEAHKMRNPESATSRLGRALRDVSESVILLSATPINLNSIDLFHLLNIVDEDNFYSEHIFPSVLEANEPLVRAQKLVLDRTVSQHEVKSELVKARLNYMLNHSEQLASIIEDLDFENFIATDAERIELANRIERCNLLSKVITRTRKAEVKEWRVVRDPVAPHVEMSDVEAELYEKVTDSVRRYAHRKDISDGFLLATPQRQLTSSMYAAVRSWKRKDSYTAEQSYEDLGVTSESKVDLSPLSNVIYDEIFSWVDLKELYDNDSKFEGLWSLIKDYFRANKDEKIIIFSYFRETLKYLSERLDKMGVKTQVLMGGMKQSKQEIIDEFKSDPNFKVLLASEVASEGVDLQFCRILVNYDLPWNPMKIEQRIGRIDRHGQKSEKIRIFNFFYKDTIDHRIYERLFKRLNIFNQALGDLEAVLGEKVSELTKDLLSFVLSPEEEEKRIEQTSKAIERLRLEEKQLEEKASSLIAHGGYILSEVQAAHDLSKRITEKDLSMYVKGFLEKHVQGYEFFKMKRDDETYKVQLPHTFSVEFAKFIKQKKLHGKTSLDTGNSKICVFSNKVFKSDKSNCELINQTHPLIQFISFKLNKLDESFVSLVAVQIKRNFVTGLPKGLYAAVISKMEFEGLRTEDVLVARMCAVDGLCKVVDKDISLNILNTIRFEGDDWPEAKVEARVEDVSLALDICCDTLERDFENMRKSKFAENNDRISFQKTSAKKNFDRLMSVKQAVLEKHKASNSKMVKAVEGQINKLDVAHKQQLIDFEQKEKLSASLKEICYLLVKVS